MWTGLGLDRSTSIIEVRSGLDSGAGLTGLGAVVTGVDARVGVDMVCMGGPSSEASLAACSNDR